MSEERPTFRRTLRGLADSPKCNRVTPTGEIVATPLRGAWCGNRGILHEGKRIVSLYRSKLWITCRLSYRDWTLPQWERGHFTVLFFHDEAVSLAAGHRPCALCRRDAYNAYQDALQGARGTSRRSARELDSLLHHERLIPRTRKRRLHLVPWDELPPGAFVLAAGLPMLVLPTSIVEWRPSGYGGAYPRPCTGAAIAITPPTSLDVLHHGYEVQLDESALAALIQTDSQHSDPGLAPLDEANPEGGRPLFHPLKLPENRDSS